MRRFAQPLVLSEAEGTNHKAISEAEQCNHLTNHKTEF